MHLDYKILDSTMLEHQKIVLSGVRDHSGLFRKELNKTLGWLNQEEQEQLKRWLLDNFNHQHADIIHEVFPAAYEKAC